MSITLIPPMYNELIGIRELLKEGFATEIARNFILGLNGASDGPLLESWLQEQVNLSGFNQMIASQDDVDTLVTLSGPMGAMANSDIASNAILNNTAFINAIATTQVAVLQIFSGDPALNYLGVEAFATPSLLGSATVMGWVASSAPAMASLAGNATAMDALVVRQVAMEAIASSGIAMEAIASSGIAMEAIASSGIAMEAVVGNQTALDEIVASAVAMNAVAANQDAMDIVVVSVSSIEKIIQSDVAMNVVAAGFIAMDAVFGNLTSRTLFFTSSYIGEAWLKENFVSRFASYLSTLTVRTSARYKGVDIPIDASLVSEIEIKSRVTTTQSSYDSQYLSIEPSVSVILSVDDNTTWLASSGPIAEGESAISIWQEVDGGGLVFNTSDDSPVTGGYSLQMSKDGATFPGRYYGLALTRRAAA